jgi:AcrR family transcriptional regulator
MGIANSMTKSASTQSDRVTLTAGDWERAALDMIAEQGFRALAIESLARRMGVTKGSFYWHFNSGQALTVQALSRWEEHDRRNLQTALSEFEDPRERLCSLFRYLPREKLTHHVYSELCAAAGHPLVEPVLERVANRRMAQLASTFAELGMSAEMAGHRARLTYSAYLGFLQLLRQRQAPSLTSEEMEHYMEHVIETLIPA